jgi:hypothetical protein
MRRGDTHFLAAVDELGIADALVVTLKHESPYCVSAAAAILPVIGQTRACGPALIETSGAIPALVRVIAHPPLVPDMETRFSQRCVVVDYFQSLAEILAPRERLAVAR